MKLLASALCLSFLAATAYASGEHAESCACAAKEEGFVINCEAPAAMSNALGMLVNNDCATDCSSEVCHLNFLIIQSHHDFCLHDQVPEPVEENFHLYEEPCAAVACSIFRNFDAALPICPTPVCDTTTGNAAFSALVSSTSGCLTNCQATDCVDNYRILRSEHDSCDEESLGEDAEAGIHNYEEICEDFNCNIFNTADQALEQLVCEEEDGDDSAGAAMFNKAMLTGAAAAAAVLF